MNLTFAPQAWEDYLWWQASDPKKLARIHLLLKEISRDPYRGTGKPEPLRHALQGYWSRRIDAEHRLVYKVAEGAILLAQLRYHYS